MEAPEGTGEPLAVDLNENEEQTVDGGGVSGKPYAALKDRSLALLAGVGGGSEPHGTINGRNVNRDAGGQRPPHGTEVLLGLAGLPGQMIDSCVISGVCGGLNGFTESFVPQVSLEGGGGLAWTKTASCPAGPGGPQLPPGEEYRGNTRGCATPASIKTSPPPLDRLSCSGTDMSNGVVCGPGRGVQTEPFLDHRPRPEDCGEPKLANGALHCEWTDSDHSDPESSADPPSYPDGDDRPWEPHAAEEEPRPAVRPQSLRTNPAAAVSLSCDATPLSPEEDGGFYFEDRGYQEDLRGVLEAGRRQSAPDKLPDLHDQNPCSDLKLMPKRFGIADFFTR